TLLELLHQGIPMSGDALNALCQLGPRASSGVPALIRILGETDGELRIDAAMITGCIGPAAEPAVPALAAALHDPGRGLRLIAGEALGRIGGAGRDALEPAARHRDARVREAAVPGPALGRQDVGIRHDVLASALDEPDPTVRAQALRLPR